jgi:RNA-directed DNA polymerase
VKANKGAAGTDGQTIEDFERKLKKNLYKIWNPMASGSYFPPPVRTVKIPKKSGGERSLGIPTVADRIAQQVVKAKLEPEVDARFHVDSYGYRPTLPLPNWGRFARYSSKCGDVRLGPLEILVQT